MYIENAYERRATLSDAELERLLAALTDATERYRYAVRNYPPDRMKRYGKPFLAKLELRVAVVKSLIENRVSPSA